MANMQQSLNADQTKGLTQARTEEWLEATKETTHEGRDMFPSDPAQPQLYAPSTQQQEKSTLLQQARSEKLLEASKETTHERRDMFPSDPAQPSPPSPPPSAQQQPTTFLQQTGEKVAHAMESVKETLGMGDKK